MTRYLLLLNGLAVLGAVVNHASGWGFTSLMWWADRYAPVAAPDFSQVGTPTYYVLRAMEQLIMFSLPAFVFVSGYFVAVAAGRERVFGWDKVGARLKTLLIPYLLWSIAIFIGRFAEGATDTSAGYARQLLFGRAAEPYYYIPLITQLFLLAPFLVAGMAANWKVVLAAAAALQLGVQAARYPVLLGLDMPLAAWIDRHAPGWFFPTLVFWFVFGTFVAYHVQEVTQWISRWRRLLPWATVCLGGFALLEWELVFRASGRQWLTPTPTVLDTFYALAFILTFLAYAQKVPARQSLDALGVRSFGIYLIHAPVLELLSRASYHLAPTLLAHQLLLVALLVAAGVAVPMLLMQAVGRSPVRPYYNYLFG
ncbi:MAG: acyltransferase family protein [Vicinamibacterales bacterium]